MSLSLRGHGSSASRAGAYSSSAGATSAGGFRLSPSRGDLDRQLREWTDVDPNAMDSASEVYAV